MSAMKDITNFSSSAAQNSHDSSPERDIFVSFVAPSSRKRGARQTSMQKSLQKSESLGNTSNEDDKSESEGEGEPDSVFMTPETPTESRPKVNRPKRKKLRLAGSPRNETPSPALSVTLNGLTKAQLVDLVNTLVAERHPDLEQELRGLIPEPDLSELEEKLKYLQRNIYKSFPYTRYGSSRDAFCYRRVNTHLAAFKKECVSQGQTLVASQLWDSAVNYVLMAWSYVDGMPDWDNPSHNKSKEQCFKGLAAQCKKALMKLKSCLSEEKCTDLLRRMKSACEQNNQLQPCLDLLTTLQSKV